ncbi:hypothetical protein PO124_15770 [Bacillus licheniformis]|nr:hypothetical protein [Bacillus licheniformis]
MGACGRMGPASVCRMGTHKESFCPSLNEKSRCSQDDMLNGVCCLIASLHWTMGSLSKSQLGDHHPEGFGAKPMNWTERLEFILLKPTQYHCLSSLTNCLRK